MWLLDLLKTWTELGHVIMEEDAGSSRAPMGNRQWHLWQAVAFSVVSASWWTVAEKEGKIFMFSSSCCDDIHTLKGIFRMKCVEILAACVLHLTGRLGGLWIISSQTELIMQKPGWRLTFQRGVIVIFASLKTMVCWLPAIFMVSLRFICNWCNV